MHLVERHTTRRFPLSGHCPRRLRFQGSMRRQATSCGPSFIDEPRCALAAAFWSPRACPSAGTRCSWLRNEPSPAIATPPSNIQRLGQSRWGGVATAASENREAARL